MPGLAELLGAGIKSGLNDNSFETAYNARSQQELQKQKAAQAIENEKAIRGQNTETLKQLLGVAPDQPLPQGPALQKAMAGMSVGMGAGGQLNIAGKQTSPSEYQMLSLDMKKQGMEANKQKQIDNKMNDYSKRLEKISDFSSTLQQIEKLTANPETGEGGVLTNPNAKLQSIPQIGGKGVPALSGLKALFDPKAAEEKKALDRVLIDYQVAKAGVRGASSPAAQAQERNALGLVSSADPQLAAKGLRSLAKSMQDKIRNVKRGYSPDVLDAAHTNYGDPEELYTHVYDDKAIGTTQPNTAPVAPKATTMAPEDQQASTWLKANPTHPAAAAVSAKLKAKGF